jgi:hypothetical protein
MVTIEEKQQFKNKETNKRERQKQNAMQLLNKPYMHITILNPTGADNPPPPVSRVYQSMSRDQHFSLPF